MLHTWKSKIIPKVSRISNEFYEGLVLKKLGNNILFCCYLRYLYTVWEKVLSSINSRKILYFRKEFLNKYEKISIIHCKKIKVVMGSFIIIKPKVESIVDYFYKYIKYEKRLV